MVNTFLFFAYLIFCSFSSMEYTVEIHIIKNQNQHSKKKSNSKISRISQSFVNICEDMSQTYLNIGKDSMNIYKECTKTEILFGSGDILIEADKPMCFHNLNQFFCNYKIMEMDKDAMKTKCIQDDNLQIILNTIKECISVCEILFIIENK
jgi:hypothetical protein